MKSLRIAIYASIILHFLRMTAKKLSPDRPRKPHGDIPRMFQGHPVQVGVAITHTASSPGPEGAPAYDYYRVATCIDCETASALINTLNGMTPVYMYPFSIINPLKEITGYELENLEVEKIHLNWPNIRKCPDPHRLKQIMQSAAITTLLHEIYTHR
jgi:hypothetical protein